jgi:hypothetical protein
MSALNDTPAHCRPMAFWFWNGLLDPATLCDQTRIMREAGMDEFVIHARHGLQTPFMSEAWMAAVQAVVEDAARTGMHVWIYDEVNWPSGTCGGIIPGENPDFREHCLDANGRIRPLDGLKGASPGRNVDYLNRAATGEFIRRCYEPYAARLGAHFGKAIRGFFNDEVRFFHARPWSTAFKEPVPTGGRYFQRLGELMGENYFRPLHDWCTQHGLEFIGHVMGEESLGSQVRYVADPYSIINLFHQPGIDHLGTAAEGLHPRVAASVSHLNGHRPVTSETFAGHPWDFQISDLYRVSGWLYAAGITRIILHGFYYNRDSAANKADWPPDIFYRWEHWNEIGPYLQWAGRVQHFLTEATAAARVAVYVPLREFWDAYQPDTNYTLDFTDGPRVEGAVARKLHMALWEIGNELVRRGIDFDFVPPQWLDRAADCLLVVPMDTPVAFAGRQVVLGSRSAAACADEIDRLLGPRLRITGPGAQPDPLPPGERLSDPHLHTLRDEGGIHARTLIYHGRPAHLIWNANPANFRGSVDLAGSRPWNLWRPDTGTTQSLGSLRHTEIELPPYRMAIILAG